MASSTPTASTGSQSLVQRNHFGSEFPPSSSAAARAGHDGCDASSLAVACPCASPPSQVTGQEQTRTTVPVNLSRLENGSEMEVQVSRFPFSWVCCPTPPCNILRDPPGRLGRAMHPNSVATLTPISGVSLPDGPALSGVWSREVWAGHRVEKEFLIPCPLVFDINTTPNPPSTSTSSASRGIRGLLVHRRHHPRCLHRAVSFHRSRHSVALRRRPNLSRRGLVSS